MLEPYRDENNIKEKLSKCFLTIVAAHKGFNIDTPQNDYGIDACASYLIKRESPLRCYTAPYTIDFQLKATTENSTKIKVSEDGITYDLKTKNYNDLVCRSKENNARPLFLILFILPKETNNWTNINNDFASLQKCAYWYLASPNESILNTDTTKRIFIPQEQIINGDFLPFVFGKYINGELHVPPNSNAA